MHLKNYIETYYESLAGQVHGGNFPAPWYATLLSQAVMYMQIGFVGLSFFGSNIWPMLGLTEPPSLWQQAQQNQIQCFMFLFLISSVAQNMCASGAFEIMLDGKVLFSKLEEKRFPTIQEIDSLLSKAGIEKTFSPSP